MTTLNRRSFLGVTPYTVGATLQTFAAFNTTCGSGRLTASHGAGSYGGACEAWLGRGRSSISRKMSYLVMRAKSPRAAPSAPTAGRFSPRYKLRG